MEHLLPRRKCFVFHNIFQNLTFRERPKELVWRNGLMHKEQSTFYSFILVRLKFNYEGMVLAPFVLLV